MEAETLAQELAALKRWCAELTRRYCVANHEAANAKLRIRFLEQKVVEYEQRIATADADQAR